MSLSHRWWHDGRGYRFAFCLFCGADYMTVTSVDPNEDFRCPSPWAEGGEEKAQEILAWARRASNGQEEDASAGKASEDK